MPARAVLDDPEQTRAFESDSFPLYRKRPLLVLLPESESQVAAAVKICAETRTPLVARGAGTGLSGGALPHEKGVLLSTAKMNRVLRIDPVAATARVEPGARNLAVSEAAAPFDLFYAPDPSSQAACSIGGNVAENSGGVRCLKYGLTGHNLLGLRFVCADGEIAEIGHQAGECAGYDLLPILTGSEGLLGIVTEITLRLRPRPAAARVALVAFASARAAGDAVSQIVAAGIVPSGLEMMDQGAVRAVEEFVGAGYPQDAAAILLFEVDGGEDEVAREMARGESIARAAGRDRIPDRQRRSRTRVVLARAQGGFSRRRPHQKRLLLHGRDDSAPPSGRNARKNRRPRARQIARLRQCLSRRRRQFASAHLLRRRERRRNAARARNGRRDYALVASRPAAASPASTESESKNWTACAGNLRGRRVVDVSRFKNGFRRIRIVESRQGGADFESLRRVRIYARRRRRKPRRFAAVLARRGKWRRR